jgi:hypothetical protein
VEILDYVLSNDEELYPYISIEKKYLFMRMKKVAGSTFLLEFCREFGDAKKAKKCQDEVRKLREESMENYFKFAVVRNPFDRIISLWNHFSRLKKIPECSFKEFLQKDYIHFNKSIECHSHSQWPSILIDGVQFVDFVARLENLDKDWDYISNELNCDIKTLTVNNNNKHKHYSEYYDDWCVKRVSEIYKKDLDLLGYEFGK